MKRQKINLNVYMVSNINRKNWLRKKLSRAGVKILSAMDTDRLRNFYRNMGIIICPSFFETYGNVPAESVAAGTPALISDNMGVAEIFKKHDLTHYIIDFGDVYDAVSKIDGFRNQRIDRQKRESLKRYLWDSVIDEYCQVCRGEIKINR